MQSIIFGAGTGRRHLFSASALPLYSALASPITDHRRFARRYPGLKTRRLLDPIRRSIKTGPMYLSRIMASMEAPYKAALEAEGGFAAFAEGHKHKKVPTRIAELGQQTNTGIMWQIGRMAKSSFGLLVPLWLFEV